MAGKQKPGAVLDEATWQAAELLISPDPDARDEGISLISIAGTAWQSPLLAYLLSTRIIDPDIKVRFHAVQELGRLLEQSTAPEKKPSNQVIQTVHHFLVDLDQVGMVRLMEVALNYISAEESLLDILRICSYAGKTLGGIVNDRNLPLEIRQQAAFFGGEIGFQTMIPDLKKVLKRIEKINAKPTRKNSQEFESFQARVMAALNKLEG
jgi:hypothetical protein